MFMVNRFVKIWVRLIALIFFISTINVYSQNISKRYITTLQGNGVLCFVFPQSGFKNNKMKSEFVYDITYLTTNDTATINFSYWDKSNLTFDSITIYNANKKYSSVVKKIFVESKKQRWHYRYSSMFLFTDLISFFDQSDTPNIILYTKQGAIELNIKARTWKKQSFMTDKILTLIKLNQ